MRVIALLELDENAEILNQQELKSDIQRENEFSPADHCSNEIKISGKWLLIDELMTINNENLIYVYDEKNENTWLKLPDSYVEENYLVDYNVDDKCPLGVDMLVKEDGYPIGVISGCKSIKQAKVENDLDGHRYKGELGIKVNNQYFLSYDQQNKEFKLLQTTKDWDRGKRTI